MSGRTPASASTGNWVAPMLAALSHAPFSREGWLFEPKLDGVRCLVSRSGDDVELLSRNQKRLNAKYPELVEAFRGRLADAFAIDGEIVTFDGAVTSFAKLQQRMQLERPSDEVRHRIPVWFDAFDALRLNGKDIRHLPLRERRTLLAKALRFKDPLRLTEQRDTNGESYFREACQKGWEGIIAKDGESVYASGRSSDWLKFKCLNEQEFVIVGYTDPKGSRTGFGALLVGFYEAGKLRYAGKVGTGYDTSTLESLHSKLGKLASKAAPFTGNDLPRRDVHWVTPKLVAQVLSVSGPEMANCASRGSSVCVMISKQKKLCGRNRMAEPGEIIEIERHEVKITRPDKVLLPADGITKRDLVEYYRRIAPRMIPHLQSRPLMLERYPDGIEEARIVQNSASSYYPKWIKTVTVKKAGGSLRQVICEDPATLAYLANQACITPHLWLSRTERPDYPDQLIFDLDPSENNFEPVRDIAQALREKLERMDLPTYVKSTGSRGLHVTVPLKPEVDFDAVRSFACQLAGTVAEEDPQHRTTAQRKAERGARVFLDTNRNAYAQTAVAPYAVRARSGAPVAIPISWDELSKRTFRPDGVTIRNVFDRLKRMDDPWKDFWRNAVSLKKAFGKMEGLDAA